LDYERRFITFAAIFFKKMNEFDLKALDWDTNPMHTERSIAIAKGIINSGLLKPEMRALEFGAGTAILSFLLKDRFKEIILIDSSEEMIRVTNEKIARSGAKNMKALLFDLENEELKEQNFDVIYTQMVLHHIKDIELLFHKFNHLLKPGGILFIADLYKEDGSFHGGNFNGHKGFDVAELIKSLQKYGFSDISHFTSYNMTHRDENNIIKEYPVFLLTSLHK
jgi:tRNA (cmo5U34)-methyltransferase